MASLLQRLALVALVLVAGTTQAATTKYWNTTTVNGDWATGGNWNPTGVPTSAYTVDIGTSSASGKATGSSEISSPTSAATGICTWGMLLPPTAR